MTASNGIKAVEPMVYRRLGSTGLKVSLLSYGAWVSFGQQFGVPEAKLLLQKAFDAGVNFYDNAEGYADGQAEIVMGQAIKELGWKRSDYVISTKIYFGAEKKGPNDTGLSRKHIVEGTKAAIDRLQLEYVDIVFAHRPDVDTPIEETVRAFNWVIQQGWAFYWGTSEWTPAQLQEAWAVADRLGLIGPAVEQPEYNLFERSKLEKEYLPLFRDRGLGTTTWSPLAFGLLTGKYSGGVIPAGSRISGDAKFVSKVQQDRTVGLKDKILQEEKLAKVDALKPIAEELGATLAQLSLAWVAKNPNVSTVIMGATKEYQIEDNLGALSVIPKLTPEVLERIEAIFQNKPVQDAKFR